MAWASGGVEKSRLLAGAARVAFGCSPGVVRLPENDGGRVVLFPAFGECTDSAGFSVRAGGGDRSAVLGILGLYLG